MNIQALGRAIAFFALAGALLATATTLSNRKDPSPQAAKTELPAAATGAVTAELVRCKAIGPEAANDAGCKAVWEDNRKRFLESGKPRQDKPIDPFPATPDGWAATSPARGAEPKDTLQSPTTQNPNFSRPSSDSTVAK
jgi:conjugative transfer region protein TrbK